MDLGNQPLSAGVSVQDRGVRAKIIRVRAIFRVPVTVFSVNIDRTRKGHLFDPGKRIIGEKDPLFFAQMKRSQTMPARAVSLRNFPVCWMSVAR